ncbi:putative disease resistance protein At3g14460 [Dioscorea cayenensis subsp. rotundata]|uniref:Disease resistance protein At3g14460 n=1 Tax=Dioscorea cayennensis subsp. rotundata TaxID=55577 RepID=A0AB40CZT5_DIOCR|nr:putative disease resistance protein At3g14460 [Dioscorea cayenensis subsp. rotundata]
MFQDTDKFYYQHCLAYHVKREGGYQIAQLRNMNELRGGLLIEGLENINNMEEAMKAKLKKKHHIKHLHLRWTDKVDGCKHDVGEQVLEALQPHPNLNYLTIEGYMGSISPSWLMTLALQNLQSIFLDKCRNWARLPSALGLLPSLKKLILVDIDNITIEGDDFMIEMFPSLELLELRKAIVSFEGMSSLLSSSSSSLTTQGRRKLFPCLQQLIVEECDGVNGLPWSMLSALGKLEIIASHGLQGQMPRCFQNLISLSELYIQELKIETSAIGTQQQQGLLPNLRKIDIACCENISFMQGLLLGVPSLEKLTIYRCSPVSLPALGHLSFLTDISLEEVEVRVEEDLTPAFPSLCTLHLMKASVLFQNLSSSVTTQNHNCFPKLTALRIRECDQVNGLHWPLFSALQYLFLINSPGVDHQLPGCLHGLSSLLTLDLTGAKIKALSVEVMVTLHALQYLHLQNCNELISMDGLQALPSLKQLFIVACPKFRSWCTEEKTEHGISLPNLHQMYIHSCEGLESLPAWLPHFPSLESLHILNCPKFHSLPEGGLPSSLLKLDIIECDQGLMERCLQEGSLEWLMIQQIPGRNYIY